MRSLTRSLPALLLAVALPLALAACAPAPIYKTTGAVVAATPEQVAAAPGQYAAGQVVWGGEVIGVNNLKDSTEISVLGHPLDSSQRPRLQKAATGRFIAVVPGFLDPMDFPKGVPVTVRGHVQGTQAGPVGESTYVYPTVAVQRADLHRWTAEEMRQGRSNFTFGVGVGGWIH